jgi:hypothetical protein
MIDQSEVMVGGSTLLSTQKALHGPEFGFSDAEIEACVAELPEELRSVMAGAIRPNEWRPRSYTAVNELVRIAAGKRKSSPEEFARRLGSCAAKQAVGSFLSIFTTFVGPKRVVIGASELWKKQYRPSGELVSQGLSDSGVDFDLRSFPSHPLGCARVTGWFETLAAAAKAKNLRIRHDECFARGGQVCRWELRWDP